MYFGKNKLNKDYGFYADISELDSYVELSDEDHKRIVDDACRQNKIIVPDSSGYPVLISDNTIADAELYTQIKMLKQELMDEDYKIIKAYEYFIVNNSHMSEYDLNELHARRQKIRYEINELESKLKDVA